MFKPELTEERRCFFWWCYRVDAESPVYVRVHDTPILWACNRWDSTTAMVRPRASATCLYTRPHVHPTSNICCFRIKTRWLHDIRLLLIHNSFKKHVQIIKVQSRYFQFIKIQFIFYGAWFKNTKSCDRLESVMKIINHHKVLLKGENIFFNYYCYRWWCNEAYTPKNAAKLV